MSNFSNYERLPGPQDTLPESPCWHEQSQCLFWVDHATRTLNSVRFPSQAYLGIPLETFGNLRFVKVLGPDQMIVGSERGLYNLNLFTNRLIPVAGSLPITIDTCINDGTVGPEGQIVIAVSDLKESRSVGGFYALGADGWTCILSNVIIANGPVFSDCGSRLYLSDTLGKRILVHDLSKRATEIHLDLADTLGYPDGLFMSPAGHLYVSFWEGSRIDIFQGKTRIKSIDHTPGLNVTCCCTLDGRENGQLVITTCSTQPEFDNGIYLVR